MLMENRIDQLLGMLRHSAPIPLRLELWNGQRFDLMPNPTVTISVPRPSALRYLIPTDMNKLGEAFVEGHIRVRGSLDEIIRMAEGLARATAGRTRTGLLRLFEPAHSRRSDRKAIEYHYDISNDFYALFLDRNMVYSCAYFRTEADDLDTAQQSKLDHILNKLMLRPGERLLDIGCGWGALIIRAAKQYGAHATGITLSRNQYEFTRRRIFEEGLEGQCEVRLQDYRDVPENQPFDKISSVGMFEHVGLRNLHTYFAKINRLLREDGLVLNHGITSAHPESREVGLGAGRFIERYVFPDGELPHLSLVLKEMSRAGLEAADVESLRRHYARTCRQWARRLEQQRERAIAAAGEKRYRIWQVYLAGCAHGFAKGWINIYQVLAAKNHDHPLPLTRDYMYS